LRELLYYQAWLPCWFDVVQPDLDATMAFYGDLFGWTFEPRTPPGAPQRYAYARLDDLVVGGVGGPSVAGSDPAGWTSYVRVDSVDDAAAKAEANGGRIVSPPVDIPRSGRVATCADPSGAVFGLWQARELRGAQLVNEPGSWNFSELHVADPAAAMAFYGSALGWECDPVEMSPGQRSWMWRVPGYGGYLAKSDSEIEARHEAAQAPAGFADAVALMSPLAPGTAAQTAGDGSSRWDVMFAVADADTAFERAVKLGARVVTPLFDTAYTRMGTVQDPQGAVLTLSQYRPPQPG
jgi:predicted enzyme related to lactoylglutathione lyase